MSEEQELEAAESRQREILGAQAQLGAMYRMLCQSPAFLDLKRELESRIADQKNKWLTAEGDEEKRCKIRGQIYNEVLDLVKSKILQGDSAGKTLEKLNAPKHPYEN